MTFILPDLPYAKDALEPHISARTLDFHHGKHHNTYVINLNNLVKDSPLAKHTLEEIITQTAKNPDQMGIFNNAAQVWNHTFFWNCMKPNGGGMPSTGFLTKLTKAFETFDDFKAQFKQAALTQFGSGWTWLVFHEGTLKIVKTPNAGVPFTDGMIPLLTCDVWEHAYYLDYQNRRPDYVDTFMTHLINWEFVEHNYPKG